jgi:hypothetical protein
LVGGKRVVVDEKKKANQLTALFLIKPFDKTIISRMAE